MIYGNLEYTIYCPSFRPHYVDEIKSLLPNMGINHFDGSNYDSCSKLMNDVIVNCPTETVFVIHDKMRPIESDIYRTLEYIVDGHGMAWLWPFGFGAFNKEVIRQVGFYDERFVGGQYEDCDMIRRFMEKDISLVMLHDVKRIEVPTSWRPWMAEMFYRQKWGGENSMSRMLDDEKYLYDIGPSNNFKFKKWKESIVDVHPPKTQDRLNGYLKALRLK